MSMRGTVNHSHEWLWLFFVACVDSTRVHCVARYVACSRCDYVIHVVLLCCCAVVLFIQHPTTHTHANITLAAVPKTWNT